MPEVMKADVTAIYAPLAEHIPGTLTARARTFPRPDCSRRAPISFRWRYTGILSTFIGVTLGSLSAVIGGRFDAYQTAADIWLTVPRSPCWRCSRH